MDKKMRLNNFISSGGFCSRREADRLIEQGKVTINDQIAVLGMIVQEDDQVKVEGQIINTKDEHYYLAFNKPIGIICTTDPKIRNNIVDFINFPERIFPIGRLDKPSEGLILLTSDGSIVNKILRSENNHEKEYSVTVNHVITPDFLEKLRKGVEIFNPVIEQFVMTKECKVTQISAKSFNITLTQGINRQIRRMCEECGYLVVSLQRFRIMCIELDDLPVGRWRHLTSDEIKKITT